MLTIGQLAQTTDVGVETIRYYEKIRLLPVPPRSGGGHRLYDDQTRRQLTFIRRARLMGFTLDQVRELLRLGQAESEPCNAVLEVASAHLVEVRKKLRDLQRLEGILASAVGKCGSQTVGRDCAVLELLNE